MANRSQDKSNVLIRIHLDIYNQRLIQMPLDSSSNQKKTMLEKLIEDYCRTIGWKNGGHAIGFFREHEDEIIHGKYEFPSGIYTIRTVNGNFFGWNYDIKELTSLKFFDNFIELIKKEEKYNTWCINDDKDIVEGMLLGLCDDKGEQFAYAITTSVKETAFEGLTEEDKKGHETYYSEREMYEIYSGYYGFPVNNKTKVKVIKFKLIS